MVVTSVQDASAQLLRTSTAPSTLQPGERESDSIFDGVTLTRPFEAVPTILTNVIENLTGVHDPRYGLATANVIMAGERLLTAHLKRVGQGSGVIATGSSVLGKILPLVSIGAGAMQVWQGWNELQSHDEGVLSVIHSKKARSGLLQIASGALLFVPGIGAILGGAATRLAVAANEMDVFKSLDWPTAPIASTTMARVLHPLDRTPHNPQDHPGPVVRRDELGDFLGQVGDGVRNLFG